MKPEREDKGVAIYPDCQTVDRTVRVGRMSKPELLAGFQPNDILLNDYARQLGLSEFLCVKRG